VENKLTKEEIEAALPGVCSTAKTYDRTGRYQH
jgi:hypothetical protein